MKKIIKISSPSGSIFIGDSNPLVFIGGPCAIESYDHSMKWQVPSRICKKQNISFIFKSCYDKDCRSA